MKNRKKKKSNSRMRKKKKRKARKNGARKGWKMTQRNERNKVKKKQTNMKLLRQFSDASHFTSTTRVARIPLTREYRDLLSYVTFLLLQCQLRVASGEINPLFQFFCFLSVLSSVHEVCFQLVLRLLCIRVTVTFRSHLRRP